VVPDYAGLADIDFAQARPSLDEHLLPALRVARDEPAGCDPEGRCRSLALELAPVRVNLIAAGLVDTPLSASLLGDRLEERRNQLRATLPIGRVVKPADVARLAIHLMANTAVTGGTYDIDRRAKARRSLTQQSMEFLVEFEIDVPEGTPEPEVEARESAEAAAAARLVDEGHLVRVWKRAVAPGETTTVLGLYRADSEAQLADLLGALPLYDWMQISVTALVPHPNDPAVARS